MDRENGDNPNGWRSIYSDDGKPGSEEPRKNEQDGVAPSREATDGVPETGERVGPESRDAVAGERPAAAEQPAAADRGRSNPEPEAVTALPPRRSSSPDVGVPRQFLSAAEEERAGKRQSRTSSPDEEGETKPKKRRKKSRPLLWSFFIALFIVLATGGSLLFYVWNGLRPVSSSETPVRVTIAKGMRASSVSEELEKSGLIRNAFLFSGWLKLKNEGSRFQAGDYDMLPGMTREEIVAKLNAGDTVAAETIRFTIPEGFTVEQIAERLSGEGFVDKAKFLAAAKNADAASGSAWTKQIPKEDSIRFALEGYLFPETYELKKGATEEDIVNRMVAELDNKLNQLPDDWQSTMQDRGLTLHQLLTIASLVEREVVIDKERPIVAGIIENRLEKKMPLQIDATIQYVLGKQKEKLTTEDTKLDSPYNTYQHAGLPPGPIASPSYKSIEAALYPDDTDYLYYVTKKDGSNEHLFAVTYKQHQKNIATSEKNAKK